MPVLVNQVLGKGKYQLFPWKLTVVYLRDGKIWPTRFESSDRLTKFYPGNKIPKPMCKFLLDLTKWSEPELQQTESTFITLTAVVSEWVGNSAWIFIKIKHWEGLRI